MTRRNFVKGLFGAVVGTGLLSAVSASVPLGSKPADDRPPAPGPTEPTLDARYSTDSRKAWYRYCWDPRRKRWAKLGVRVLLPAGSDADVETHLAACCHAALEKRAREMTLQVH